MPSYTTPELVRELLDVDEVALTDTAADSLIADVCDLIDEELGARPVDPDTGRKVVEGDVEAWQWSKLERAATKMTAALYRDPGALERDRWRREKGPDFELEDPLGARSLGGASAMMLLNQSGLRRLTGRFGPSRGARPPWYGFVYNDPDEE